VTLANKPKLYLAMYKFIKYLYTLVHNFPKEYKYSLGENILQSGWETLDDIVFANNLPNTKKKPYIKRACGNFERLILKLHMAFKLKLFSPKQMEFIILHEVEIEKMLKGWYKWANQKY